MSENIKNGSVQEVSAGRESIQSHKILPEETLSNIVRASAPIPGITLQNALSRAYALPSTSVDEYLRTEVRDLQGQIARLGCYFNAINELGRRNSEEDESLSEMDSLNLRCARINADIMADRANKGLRIISSNRAMVVPSLNQGRSLTGRKVSKEVLMAYKAEPQPVNRSVSNLRENFNPFPLRNNRIHPSKILPEIKVVNVAPSVAEELMGIPSPSITKSATPSSIGFKKVA